MTRIILTIVCLLLVWPAIAQDPNPSVVEFDSFFGWMRPYVLEVLGLVVAAAIAWATKKFHDLTGIEIEAKHREALQSALRNGAALALDKIPTGVALDLKSPAIAAAVNYVLKSVPDAVEFFNLTPDKIVDLLKPKLVAQPAVLVEPVQ